MSHRWYRSAGDYVLKYRNYTTTVATVATLDFGSFELYLLRTVPACSVITLKLRIQQYSTTVLASTIIHGEIIARKLQLLITRWECDVAYSCQVECQNERSPLKYTVLYWVEYCRIVRLSTITVRCTVLANTRRVFRTRGWRNTVLLPSFKLNNSVVALG